MMLRIGKEVTEGACYKRIHTTSDELEGKRCATTPSNSTNRQWLLCSHPVPFSRHLKATSKDQTRPTTRSEDTAGIHALAKHAE